MAGAKRALEMIIGRFEILPLDRDVVTAALALPGPDFEDNVQIACAVNNQMDMIITRNKADFKLSPILAIEPAEILGQLHVP